MGKESFTESRTHWKSDLLFPFPEKITTEII